MTNLEKHTGLEVQSQESDTTPTDTVYRAISTGPGTQSIAHSEKEIDPKLAEALEKIDFTVLREICAEKLSEIGVDTENMRFVEKDEITNLNKLYSLISLMGRYDLEENNIGLNVHFAELLEKLTHGGKTTEQTLLSVLCHEESHALSHQSCGVWDPAATSFVEKQEQRSGFAKKGKLRFFNKLVIHPDADYLMFNEGVTDLFGKELFDTYMERNGEDISGFLPKYIEGYPLSRTLVKTIIEKISSECEIEKNLVWRAIQRGYVLGEDAGGDLMRRLFKDVASDSLFTNIKNPVMDMSPNLLVAIGKIKLKTWSDKDRKRVRRWFKHLDAVMENPTEKAA